MSKVNPEFKKSLYAFHCQTCGDAAVSTPRGVNRIGTEWAWKLFCPVCKKISVIPFRDARMVVDSTGEEKV